MKNYFERDEKIDVQFGIDIKELIDKKIHENQIFYDKYGIKWKFDGIHLYSSDDFLNDPEWKIENTNCIDLYFKRFFNSVEYDRYLLETKQLCFDMF